MPSQLGAGTCPTTTSVGSVAFSSTGPVQPANSRVMIVLCVCRSIEYGAAERRLIWILYSARKMWPFLSHGRWKTCRHTNHPQQTDGVMQHCLMTWIQQESSKGLCPMCRQSRFPDPVDLMLMMLILTTRRIRVEGKRGIMIKKTAR